MVMEDDEKYIETMRLLVEQKHLDVAFLENGAEDKVLEKQVEINSRRHELDIVDREEIIFKDDKDKEFVQ